MAQKIGVIGKVFSPYVLSKAMKTFDKAMAVIVASCWGGAILIVLFSIYTLSLSVQAKKAAIEAAAQEPSLPTILSGNPSEKEMKPLVDRLQKRFPGITFSLASDRSLTVSAVNGEQFRSWLTVLSYIDTMSPEFRWHIKDFCVGEKCLGKTPMQAVLKAEKISFSIPDS